MTQPTFGDPEREGGAAFTRRSPVLRLATVTVGIVASVTLLTGTATASPSPSPTGQSSATHARAAVSNPVPENANGWENCGDYICTFYFTRTATRAIDRYFEGVGVSTGFLGKVICGVAGYFVTERRAGFGLGMLCDLDSRLDWPGEASDAVAANGCLQLEYANADEDNQSFLSATPGWTTHGSYCFE